MPCSGCDRTPSELLASLGPGFVQVAANTTQWRLVARRDAVILKYPKPRPQWPPDVLAAIAEEWPQFFASTTWHEATGVLTQEWLGDEQPPIAEVKRLRAEIRAAGCRVYDLSVRNCRWRDGRLVAIDWGIDMRWWRNRRIMTGQHRPVPSP